MANAVLDGADCIMLSGETAKGQYPLQSVTVMSTIAREAESAVHHRQLFDELRSAQTKVRDPTRDTALAAAEAAINSLAACIVVTTDTGRSAVYLAGFRPRCPVIAISRDLAVSRQLHLHRGVFPVWDNDDPLPVWVDDMDRRIQRGLKEAWRRGVVEGGAYIVVVTGWRSGPGSTNTVRIIQLPEYADAPSDLYVLRSRSANRITTVTEEEP